MPKSKRKITDEIREYVLGSGSAPSYWYVGIAKNAREALFRDHGVLKSEDLWIYRTARSSSVAHQARDILTSELETEGSRDAVGGDPRMVYAYRMAAHTDP